MFCSFRSKIMSLLLNMGSVTSFVLSTRRYFITINYRPKLEKQLSCLETLISVSRIEIKSSPFMTLNDMNVTRSAAAATAADAAACVSPVDDDPPSDEFSPLSVVGDDSQNVCIVFPRSFPARICNTWQQEICSAQRKKLSIRYSLMAVH